MDLQLESVPPHHILQIWVYILQDKKAKMHTSEFLKLFVFWKLGMLAWFCRIFTFVQFLKEDIQFYSLSFDSYGNKKYLLLSQSISSMRQLYIVDLFESYLFLVGFLFLPKYATYFPCWNLRLWQSYLCRKRIVLE